MNIKYISIAILFVFFTIFNTSQSAPTNIECDFCQLSVDTLADVAKADNLTFTQVQDAMERICNSIPSNYTGICNYVLTSLGPVVIEQVLNGTRSEIVCTELTICNSVNAVFPNIDNCHYSRTNKIIISSIKFTEKECENDQNVNSICKYLDEIKTLAQLLIEENNPKCVN